MISQVPPLAFLMNQTPMELFKHGGIVMWPVLTVSFLLFTVVIERMIFLFAEKTRTDPAVAGKMIEKLRQNDVPGAIALGRASKDSIARVYTYALTHKESSLEDAYSLAANNEIARFSAGLATMDTCITAAPLLGLLGTVTGMMGTFGALGTGDIASSAGLITGGVAEALIATAAGLMLAVVGLFPSNILNARLEGVRTGIQNGAHALAIALKQAESPDLAPPAAAHVSSGFVAR
jgi:biopolymer transport protein ExbB